MSSIDKLRAGRVAYRAMLLGFAGDPGESDDAARFEEDGLLIVEAGRVVAKGSYAALADQLTPDTQLHDLTGKLIVPGFIDTQVHYPQTDMIASPASGLLPWL